MRYFKKICGGNVYLSPINIEDYPLYTQWLNDPEVAVNLTLMCKTIGVVKEKIFLDKLVHEENMFAIVCDQTDELIGNCGLLQLDTVDRTAEFGIFIGNKKFWNSGYGSEATRLLLGYAFRVLNLNNIMLRVFAYNARAIASYRKIGFKEIGRRRAAHYFNMRYHDVVYMDMLAEEFTQSIYDTLIDISQQKRV